MREGAFLALTGSLMEGVLLRRQGPRLSYDADEALRELLATRGRSLCVVRSGYISYAPLPARLSAKMTFR